MMGFDNLLEPVNHLSCVSDMKVREKMFSYERCVIRIASFHLQDLWGPPLERA